MPTRPPKPKSATLPSKAAPYDAVLDRLKRLHPRLIDLSLGRIQRLLAALGNPERSLAPVVHVAGTNGKGSTIALLRSMLEQAGLRVHVYTSPHLVRFAERVVVGGQQIADDRLDGLLNECEAANGGAPITFFEITTAAAFLAFSRAPAEIVLLETGLGGRLDATNVIARPALTAITPVAVDHVQFLGETVAEIAYEKAGILKPGVPCVTAPQDPAAMGVIAARAAELDAPLIRWHDHWSIKAVAGGMEFRDGGETLRLPRPALAGAHQLVNAGMAVACARRMPGLRISEAAIAAGLAKAVWPGRLQLLAAGKLTAAAGPDLELWLDGGHNRAAAEALADHVTDPAGGWRDRPLYLVFGAMNTRPPEDFLRPLAARAAALRAVPVSGEENTLDPADAVVAARAVGLDAAAAADVASALKDIRKIATEPGRVLICGSLYLAGAVLAENG
jgi:dihydrofolate synthase/folylpolyglutamate synthase